MAEEGKSSNSMLALIVGGLVVAVIVLYFLFAGGGDDADMAGEAGDPAATEVESDDAGADGAAEGETTGN